MKVQTLVILGNDKISHKAFNSIRAIDGIFVCVDKSSSLKRVLKLLYTRRLRCKTFLRMLVADLLRETQSADLSKCPCIKLNTDLLKLIDSYSPDRIILFRAGLIINKKVISRGIPLLNIHCADVPRYGGLGSIQRALDDSAYNQSACLHHVTARIDDGTVYLREPYILNPQKSYLFNENLAYNTGISLLKNALCGNLLI